MEFGITPVKNSKRMTEDMAMSESVSGVSRSGRVRKKSAKLMEMEDLNSPFYDSEFVGDGLKNRKKMHGKVMSPTSSGLTSSSTFGISPMPMESKLPSFAAAKRKPASQLSPGFRSLPQTQTVTLPQMSMRKQASPPPPMLKGDRVIAIKQLAPPTTSFETLSGSAYLMGDDIHFITGEPVDSCTEDNNMDDQMSPLKIDVSGHDEHSVALQEDGLKMKFILSPKVAKVEMPGKNKKRPASTKSVALKKITSRAPPKSKKKLLQPSMNIDMSASDMLSSGGILPSSDSGSADSSEEDDLAGDSKLIIAEPFAKKKMFSKSKKKITKEPHTISMATSKFGSPKFKKKPPMGKSLMETESPDSDDNAMMTDQTGQQHSVYLKEKNSSKKKATKKLSKKKEKSAKKQRPVSAYMLWAKEYRKVIVSETPGIDFASISRRLGEIWKSISDKEKLNWRRKAKLLENKTTGLISTGTNATDSERVKATSKPSNSKADDSGGSRDVHKPVGTTPLDVAAHLKLLGESLSIIGQRLTEHEGQIAVSGSLSVLLDSTLCALGPLLCLTSEVDQLNGCTKEMQESILDNIAYIMPGL